MNAFKSKRGKTSYYHQSLFLIVLLQLNISAYSHVQHIRINKTSCYGTFEGLRIKVNETTADVFSSIPFALPPINDLRFEYPVSLKQNRSQIWKTDGEHNCKSFDSSDYQTTEDCLYMKVISPHVDDIETVERFPAVIWIHGGSYRAGSKNMYMSENVIKHFSSKNIVFMSPNYRLGALGFMTLNHNDFSGNYGLEDIIKAIEFFLDIADIFNVDKSRITIAGESAGAALASILSVSPRTMGLFHSVLLVSGSSQNTWAVRPKATRISSELVVQQCECSRKTVLEIKQCMKMKPTSCILDIYSLLIYQIQESWYECLRMGTTIMTPIIDGFRGVKSILPEYPDELIKKNARKPVLLSSTANEGQNLRIFNNILKYICDKQISCTEQFSRMIDSLVSWNISARHDIQRLLRMRYITSDVTTEGNTTKVQVGNLLTRDMTSSLYHEALLNAQRNVTVYVLENHLHQNELTSHGHDTACLFGSNQFHSGCENCLEKDGFGNKFGEILSEFILTKKLNNFHPFTVPNRVAHYVTEQDIKLIDWHTEDYYFWYQTIPALQELFTKKSKKLS